MLSPATQVGYHQGRVPANKGLKFPVEVADTGRGERAHQKVLSSLCHGHTEQGADRGDVPGRITTSRNLGSQAERH